MNGFYSKAARALVVALAFSTGTALAQADQDNQANNPPPATTTTQTDANGTTTTTTVVPAGTPRSVSGRVGGLNFARQAFSVSVDNQSLAIDASNAKITYNGQNANIYRLMGGPTVDVSGRFVPSLVGGMGGMLFADTINVTSGPTERLQPSSYTEQAQPPFGAGDLVTNAGGSGNGSGTTTSNQGFNATGSSVASSSTGTSRNYGSTRHSRSHRKNSSASHSKSHRWSRSHH